MFDAGLASALRNASVFVLPVLIAIPLHEAAHGLAAWRLGDDTAYQQGRVTLNPLRHIDPFGTILLPAMLLLAQFAVAPGQSPFLFGYAKPVPVNFQRLHHPRRDMVLVAAAGPAMNVLLAVISALLIYAAAVLPDAASRWAGTTFERSIELNLVLAVFNMIPLPPLDGGRVLVGLLPRALGYQLVRVERYGILIVLGLFIVLPYLGRIVNMDLDLLPQILLPPINFLYNAILSLTGVGDRIAAIGLT